MYSLKMFTTEEELCELTGLPPDNYHEALWDAGFILDDWDVGFESDKPLDHVYTPRAEEDYEYDPQDYSHDAFEEEEEYRTGNDDADWLVWRMENYCVGYKYTEYNGKHYYLVYHS
jgi:hypothetical protein